MDFSKKIVLITGGTGGLGKAIANTFLEKGSKVCICDINVKAGEEIVKEFEEEFGHSRIIFSKCDVTKDEDFEAAFETCNASLGKVNILINNAGIVGGDFKGVLDVNIGGIIRGTNTAMAKMGKHEGGTGGHVVNIGSIAGLSPYTVSPHYSTSKAAVIHYTRNIGDEFYYQYTGVMVQSLNPSFVDTPILTSSRTYDKKAVPAKALLEMNKRYTTVKPLLKPQQIADALLVLLNEGKKGAAMVVEQDKPPYYCEAVFQLPLAS